MDLTVSQIITFTAFITKLNQVFKISKIDEMELRY